MHAHHTIRVELYVMGQDRFMTLKANELRYMCVSYNFKRQAGAFYCAYTLVSMSMITTLALICAQWHGWYTMQLPNRPQSRPAKLCIFVCLAVCIHLNSINKFYMVTLAKVDLDVFGRWFATVRHVSHVMLKCQPTLTVLFCSKDNNCVDTNQMQYANSKVMVFEIN